ncbi:DEAD/DEAH box helicase [Paracoccus siganidrum]|uniref:DEAD-box ATP-dependent RNA helicase RhpA n=1 Tax=Paracoccus siganidrum TaxID=1276757 RepID=A0A419A699_9RHOB|nr:DEAD/DEAH box helicase [Paracoccus siganidrum]RJL12780.1 DEAD/DEAH box helicase [Paracoccus siganidrum]RMC41100.1 ATP-dependent helicase [Paracoccus siganidrum]
MTKFSDLKLDPKVLKAVAEAGYENPTPIQAGAIPPALEGRDVLGIAQTGTGKTASFTLPMITLLGRGRARARMPRSLVLCPTRELAAQVAENFDTYAKHTKLTKALLIGGVSFAEQDKLIDRGVDVLIATPGRLLDHFERGKLLLTGVQIMVVDEADRMLDMGFIPDIERIFQLTPFTRQTLFFSATMAPEIERITNTFLHAPERIEVARQATASETITQRLIQLTPTRKDQTSKQKRELLRAVIDAEGEALTNAIIFCNRKTDVDIVAKSLKKHGYDASPIHGDLDQSHRTRTLDGFRDGKLRLLVASDVAARGLDIPAVSHVLNFDLPSHAEDYVHRIGRTGRAGRLGTAISISTPADEKLLAAIENLVKQTLPRVDAPEGFTPTESATSAPRPRDDRKGPRSGGRRRDGRRDEERSERPRVEAPEEQRAEARPEPRREEPARENRDNRRDRDRDGHRRGRGRDESRGPAIVGMGDHVPEFMLVELRRALISAASGPDDAPETPEAAPAEAAAEKPAAKPKRTRRRKDSAAPEPVAENAAAAPEAPVETVAPEAVIEAPVEAVADPIAAPEAAAEPAAKPKRTRRKKAEPAEATEAAPAPEEAPKPRRTRSRKKPEEAEAPAEAAAAPEAETAAEPEKPKRTRRKKVEAPAATEETAAEEPAPKPKRTRRKKAEAGPDDAGTPENPAENAADAEA